MAWNHFTGYLTAADLLTTAQRNELYDALEERAAAVQGLTGASYSASSDIRNCGLVTDWLERSAGSSPLRLEAAINAIASRFGKASVLTASSFTGTIAFGSGHSGAGAIFYDAASLCGVTPADVGSILGSPLDDHRRWNLYRAALILMAHPQLAFGATHFSKYGTESYDPGTPGEDDVAWGAVKSEMLGASEVTETLSTAGAYLLRQHTEGGSNTYTLKAQRVVYAITIPATAGFAANSGIYVAVQNDAGVALTLTFQGSAGAISAPVYPTLKYQFFAGSGATGANNADLRFDHYTAGAGLDALRPDPAPFNDQFFGATTTAIYGAPAWVNG